MNQKDSKRSQKYSEKFEMIQREIRYKSERFERFREIRKTRRDPDQRDSDRDS